MNRRTIWLVSLLIGLSFAGLLYLQTRYVISMVRMSRSQFASTVQQSLEQASRAMERRETFNYLQMMAYGNAPMHDSLPSMRQIAEGRLSASEADSPLFLSPFTVRKVATGAPSGNVGMGGRNHLGEAAAALQDYVRSAYMYQKEVLDEVVFTVLYNAGEHSFEERIDFAWLSNEVKRSLHANGIDMDFHLTVNTADGNVVYRCADYDPRGSENTFQQMLFRSDPIDKRGTMYVHFPNYREVVLNSAGLMLPAIGFTFVLFITFLVSVWLVFRQKQIAELRNDFVHNMTHEFKTPLSSISLAAQMLSDSSVPKTDRLLERLSNTIVSESRRLRMQVDKVLQMSLIDNHNLSLKFNDLNVHEVVDNVMAIFSLKVQQNGGEIASHLEAAMCDVYADEMHFTNVIYNLLDNAVKYQRPDVPIHLEIRTYNPSPRKLCVSIADNGIGIRRDSVKHIFERFYRVSTGDKHDVKGFGLGLAYVKAIIDQHRGSIHCDSTPGQGTTFTITLPLIEKQN